MLLEPVPHRVSIAAIVEECERLVTIRAQGDQILHRVDAVDDVMDLNARFGAGTDSASIAVAFEDSFQQPAELRPASLIDRMLAGCRSVLGAKDVSGQVRRHTEEAQALSILRATPFSLMDSSAFQVQSTESTRPRNQWVATLTANVLRRAALVFRCGITTGAIETDLARLESIHRGTATLAQPLRKVNRLYDAMSRHTKCVGGLIHRAMHCVGDSKTVNFFRGHDVSGTIGASHQMDLSGGSFPGAVTRLRGLFIASQLYQKPHTYAGIGGL